jgi:hypothetical protein
MESSKNLIYRIKKKIQFVSINTISNTKSIQKLIKMPNQGLRQLY